MNNIRSRPFLITVGLIIIDIAFFGLTNPKNVAPILLMVGFGLVMLTIYWLFLNMQKLIAIYIPWLKAQKYFSLSLALSCGAVMALQSIGQLTARDSLLIFLAVLVVYAYTSYGRKSSS